MRSNQSNKVENGQVVVREGADKKLKCTEIVNIELWKSSAAGGF